MDNKEKDKLYSDLSNVCIQNLYTVSKKTELITFKNFDTKNKNHLFLFEMAKIVNNLFGYKIQLQCGLFKFLCLKNKSESVQRISPKKIIINGIKCEDFLGYIAKAWKVDENIWSEIYKDWYEK